MTPRCRPILILLLAACIGRLWVMPLVSSFWVDEMGTAFVVHQGPDDPSLRVAPQVPASIYYVLPRAAERLLGFSEVAYRLPSFLALALALWAIARLAARLIHPDAAWFAVFACLSLRGFDYQAADARPYALGSLVFAVSLLGLARWLDRGRWADALIFAVPASLLWRVHLVFWPLYGLLAFYAVLRIARKESAVSWARAGAVFLGIAASLLPVVSFAFGLYRQAGAHVIVPKPGIGELSSQLKLGMVTAGCAGASLLGLWRKWPRGEFRPARVSLALILAWWLIDPLALFAFSWATGNSVFVPRYVDIALPGAALAATLAVAGFLPARLWRPAAAVIGLGVLIFVGHWNRLWPPHHNSDWRAAASALNRVAAGQEIPVICPSPFIEARPPVWNAQVPARGFLYSHLAVYHVAGRAYAFPFEQSVPAREHAAGLMSEVLEASGRFAIYGGEASVNGWRDWFRARPELEGWTVRPLGTFGDVAVVVFERNTGVAEKTERSPARYRSALWCRRSRNCAGNGCPQLLRSFPGRQRFPSGQGLTFLTRTLPAQQPLSVRTYGETGVLYR